MFNNKLLIKKIITIFIGTIILNYINLSFAQDLTSYEEKTLPKIILFDENKKKNKSEFIL